MEAERKRNTKLGERSWKSPPGGEGVLPLKERQKVRLLQNSSRQARARA
jgi:hypothetical protein